MVTSPDAAQTQADETAEREANFRMADEGHGLTAATNHLATDAIHGASSNVTERTLQTKTSTHAKAMCCSKVLSQNGLSKPFLGRPALPPLRLPGGFCHAD